MAGRDRLRSIGLRRGRQLAGEFGDVIREHRLSLGLSRRALAAAIGISESKLARWERSEPPHPDVVDMAITLQMLGQKLVLKVYPVGGVLRDAGHVRLTQAFMRLVGPSVQRRLEAPMPLAGDLRAWDVLLQLGSAKVGVAVETNLRDLQALLRREELKLRDSNADRWILVIGDTHANRASVAASTGLLRQALPLNGRALLPALRDGRDPGANGLLIVTAGDRGQ